MTSRHDLKTRSVADILIAVTDGLKGMSERWPWSIRERHATDLHRASDPNSLDYAGWKERRPLALAARPWRQKFPTVGAVWRRPWSNMIPFFACPPHVRRVIYTNAIESVNARPLPQRRRGQQLIWLELRNITAEWSCTA